MRCRKLRDVRLPVAVSAGCYVFGSVRFVSVPALVVARRLPRGGRRTSGSRRLARTERKERRALCFRYSGQARDVETLIMAIAPKPLAAFATESIPHPQDAVVAAAGQRASVSGKRHAPDRTRVSPKRRAELAGLGFPQPNQSVNAAARDNPPVFAQRNGINGAGMGIQGSH